jgi:hypothetical protein
MVLMVSGSRFGWGTFLAVQGDTSITLSGLNLQPESRNMFGKSFLRRKDTDFHTTILWVPEVLRWESV